MGKMNEPETKYFSAYDESMRDPDAFWGRAAEAIDWFSPFDRVFDPDMGVYGRWFPGATCNTCHNCLDRHVEAGRGEQPAIFYDSPVTGSKAVFTYEELLAEVVALAAVLGDRGVVRGDRVIIYMPMIPEAVMAMLACARIGAVHSVVFGGFAAKELASRIDDAQPKAIISASCGIEPTRIVAYKPLFDEAFDLARHQPECCLIVQRSQLICDMHDERDLDYRALVDEARADGRSVPCVPVQSTDPLYILYTSGTTGRPKGVVRDNGGHMVALQWSMGAIYGLQPGDVFWTASDVGWVVGHSYIVYAPLLNGNTTILFEGKPVGTPDAGVFWRIIEEYRVKALFTAPTAFRAIKKEDPAADHVKNYDLSSFKTLFLAGERADPDTIEWARKTLNVPVIDHWWQTETGWTIAGNPMGLGALPVKIGSPTVPMPGYGLRILDDGGESVPAGTLGNIVIKLPLPPAGLVTLWNADDAFRAAYLETFPGFYRTADAGMIDEDGYVFVMARTDDIINVAGHRLSTGALEEVLAGHPDIAECAVIGVSDATKGQMPFGFYVLSAGVKTSESDVERDVMAMVRKEIGAIASLRRAIGVARLPKTRSGKILRASLQKLVEGRNFDMPATIDDPAILTEIAEKLQTG